MKKSSLKIYIFLTSVVSVLWLSGSWWHYACNIKNTCNSDNTIASNTNNKSATLSERYDTDGDGLSDIEEAALGTDPLLLDSDQDSIPDSQEIGVDLDSPLDSDEDGLIDALDADDDNDGISTFDEEKVGTSSLVADTDKDGILDSIEIGEDANAPLDTDGDGIINALDTDDDDDNIDTIKEALLGTNPLLRDTDADGISDSEEVGKTADKPKDSNKNGVFDAVETDSKLDQDNDGLPDATEALLNTDPLNGDSDGDGIDDATEVGSNSELPLDTDLDGIIDALDSTDNSDSDNDGISNSKEILLNSNPELADSDDDGINDAEELGGNPDQPLDTDNDGLLNLNDRDDDNDNLSTRYETRIGTNPLSADSDNDGLMDNIESKSPNSDELQDTDNDKLINPVDADDDNDSIPTRDELALGTDHLKADTDSDGINDAVEIGANLESPKDSDKDGIIDALDTKDDPIDQVAAKTSVTSEPKETDELKSDGKAISLEMKDKLEGSDISSSILYFPFISADPVIEGDALDYLDKIAAWMSTSSENWIELVGHTDNIGSKNSNLALGIKRVMVIRELLIDRGAPFQQIEIMSRGETQPITSNKTKAGRKQNRRVEITPLNKQNR